MAISESNMPAGGPMKISGSNNRKVSVRPKSSMKGKTTSFYVAPKGKSKGK